MQIGQAFEVSEVVAELVQSAQAAQNQSLGADGRGARHARENAAIAHAVIRRGPVICGGRAHDSLSNLAEFALVVAASSRWPHAETSPAGGARVGFKGAGPPLLRITTDLPKYAEV